MGISLLFLALCFTLLSLFTNRLVGVDTISPTQPINDNQIIVSKDQKFELGFFNAGDSFDRFLGIWYKNIPVNTIVWVANREQPLRNSSGILKLDDSGKLVLLNQSGNVIWFSNSSRALKNPVAQLLDSGNLVLKEAGNHNAKDYTWQSFDYPSDTLLPGMKLGWNWKTGLNVSLRSWKNLDDPSPGEYTYSVDPSGLPQLVLRKGSNVQFRSGPWYGTGFSGAPTLIGNPVFVPIFVSNDDEVYYSYQTTGNVISRFVVSHAGSVQHLSWNARRTTWHLLFTVQGDRCDTYDLCGVYGSCNIDRTPNCECLEGFDPKSSRDWDMLDWSGGCVRKDPLVCGQGDGFLKFTGLKLPESSQFRVNVSMSIKDCRTLCLDSCSCTAYAELDISGNSSECATWFGDLIDIRRVGEYGQDLYVRVAASSLGRPNPGEGTKRKEMVIVITISMAAILTILASVGLFLFLKKQGRKGKYQEKNQVSMSRIEDQEEDLELPLFELPAIMVATNNFSPSNKIGEGGFGPVYKGVLQSGQEVAVKRQGEFSGQGLQEFKNEVIFISKLQHRNLVKLLGCCIQGEERVLIYEYMANRSLDSVIFDETRRYMLNWKKRLDIIIGIARGLLYLHRDSRLRIIHRDLKASNVLLDNDMNPKISDFGMARMFGSDQTEANTKRVVGTYGYMPPEYAIDGNFSLKSDVFSFGVILLEIISGKKNRGFFHPDHKFNLLGHAWKLFNEGKARELVDKSLENDQVPESEVIRCIQVGLFCVQQRPEDRPTMQSVLSMLDSETVFSQPDQPGRPGFYAERCLSEVTDSSSIGKLMSNEMTVTLVEGR
ncbi:G-type lectin S-receptor-like serine/threonine-protein kinase At4g27290 isoform X2 [Carica papaya]|uniref:G-type lectin S-receptor-like serine/threonine-protein kinase At4g27290 isoform X2 n=1 Tax=Carica papaya TaxID=3649 RepID=UPI000B8C71B8|nr:G-type lectin S-receptor-like serine/threonine-protein kinase At4g27290 isoform X2 [Carica papaya]